MAGSYLLKASENDLSRWREGAAAAGVSLAQFIRTAVEDALERDAFEADAVAAPPRPRPVPPPTPPPPPKLSGHQGELSGQDG